MRMLRLSYRIHLHVEIIDIFTRQFEVRRDVASSSSHDVAHGSTGQKFECMLFGHGMGMALRRTALLHQPEGEVRHVLS